MSDVLEVDLTPIKFIGQGRFGSVYSARSDQNGKIYAVKQIKIDRSRDGEDLNTEKEIHQHLSHNCVNIVQFYMPWVSSRQRPVEFGKWFICFFTV